MTFTCDFCGHLINTEVDKKCPNCGATYASNKVQLQEQKNKIQQDALKLKREALELEHKKAKNEEQKILNQKNRNNLKYQESASKTAKLVAGVIAAPFVIFFLILGSVMLFGVINAIVDTTSEKSTTEIKNEIVIEEVQETPVTVNFNEKAELSKYSIMIDEAKEMDPYPWTVERGYRYVAFHFVVENLSDKTFKFEEKIICNVDGYQMDNVFLSDVKELKKKNIDIGLKIEGYLIYEIPIDLDVVTFKCGDYITINVENNEIAPLEK